MLTGELVRIDLPDPGVLAYGVLTPERGLFAVCSTELQAVANQGRLVLPGLDVDARYRVRLVRTPQLPPPLWAPWTMAPEGVLLSGRALATVGVRLPYLPPEQAFILEADRVDG